MEKVIKINIYFFNVGHGDSSVIEAVTKSDSKRYIVIDTSIHFMNGLICCPVHDFLSARDIKKIDYLIVTHPHRDHYSAIENLLENYDIGKIVVPPILDFRNEKYKELIEAFRTAIRQCMKKADGFRFGSLLYLLEYLEKHPDKILSGGIDRIFPDRFDGFNGFTRSIDINCSKLSNGADTYLSFLFDPLWNECSVISHFNCFGYNILFPGDSTVDELNAFIDCHALHIDVLKASHHGSLYGTNREFVQRIIKDRLHLVISADGENSSELIRGLKGLNVSFYCTNTSKWCMGEPICSNFIKNVPCKGTIQFSFDKDGFSVSHTCQSNNCSNAL